MNRRVKRNLQKRVKSLERAISRLEIYQQRNPNLKYFPKEWGRWVNQIQLFKIEHSTQLNELTKEERTKHHEEKIRNSSDW